ncbi:MAG TPA: protein kinase [Ideonella sp.]|uniref:serine/threonine-protein kinase n=1 Tax=Ideonella sp. TaxID=1929293 RepID=UPI002BB871F5|nr:protein kinase [Ideonella sp.]HSI51702.1 protein kinase [Ideonella sp.]
MKKLDKFSSNWAAISGLLDEALSLPPAQREAWLAGLSGADADHREALHALLAGQSKIESGDFLAKPPALHAMPADAGEGLAPGGSVGPYRLVERLAAGGMGTVWIAERADGLMKRQVALKLPRAVWGDAFAERLAREREILASLEHPHIARLYDAGTDEQGRPYLAMELVDGEPIDAWCRERALPLRERIGLLLQVMAAVTHAHAKLVVHRDLKPSNILVTQDGQVKLLDFGIAKLLQAGEATQETGLTAAHGRAMTPDYASPEQIAGEPLGTASDIYSAAVVAFELLAGSRPYRLKRASAAQLEEAIASVEPALASQVADTPAQARQLKGDLDAILHKALKKQTAQRYATMDAFAQDLRRHLAGEPVEARPDRLSYRFAKFVGRYRLQVAAGGLVAVALVAGASVAVWQARLARNEADAARAVQQFLESVFSANSADQADPIKARDTTARELLDRGAQRIDTELRDAPFARLRLLKILASMYEDMELEQQQLALCRKRLALARELTGPDSDDTVLAMADTASALTQQEHREEAQQLLKDGAAILDARHDDSSQARLRIELRQAALDARLDPAHGEGAAARAVAIARRGAPTADLGLALKWLGQNAYYAGHLDKARDALTEAIALGESHPELGASHLFTAYVTLGDVQGALGAYEAARASYMRSLEIARRTAAEPGAVHFTESNFANFLFDTGRFHESLAVVAPAYRFGLTGDLRMGIAAPMMVAAHGRALIALGRTEEGLADVAKAQQLGERFKDAPDFAVPLWSFRADGLTDLGRFDEARAAIQQMQDIADKAKYPAGNFIRPAQRRLLVAQGQGAQALAAYQQARAERKMPKDPTASEPIRGLADAAWLQMAAGHAADAERLARQVLDRIAQGQSADYQREHEALATLVLGQALLAQQHPAEARPVLEQAVKLHRAEYDAEHSLALADALHTLADCQRALGESADEALADEKRIRATHVRAAVAPSR